MVQKAEVRANWLLCRLGFERTLGEKCFNLRVVYDISQEIPIRKPDWELLESGFRRWRLPVEEKAIVNRRIFPLVDLYAAICGKIYEGLSS
ncbi:hypothetical protein CEXT_385151 [Caerostris extrusa]|uniref:Uncharacterized protein n=1 Tax=Caerostris extrusa TaxID=172846 RepID=A0AAV4T6S5_CAEEX|nr:hypothetical protein CEXT_385151 [Caerostris extrusa]